MNWYSAQPTAEIGIDWQALGDRPVDPYLIWFDLVGPDLVGEKNFERWYRKKLPVLLELHKPFTELAEPGVEVPAVYREPLGSSGKTSRFISARVEPGRVAALFQNAQVKRFQLELSRIDRHDDAYAAQAKPRPAETSEPGEMPPLTWVGVIDSGCAFAHRNFRLAAAGLQPSTRVRYLWDQGPAPQPDQAGAFDSLRGPAAPGLGYGAELGPVELDAAMRELPSETACYAAAGIDVERALLAQHGYGVLDLAAGAPSPLTAGPPPLSDGNDGAGSLPLLFVQLDSFDDRATNITSLGVHVLDGLRWMIDRVESHPLRNGGRVDRQTRLVVNISYGGLAGPHDGSSVLERAIDELIQKRKNLFVVLAAGNSHVPELPTHSLLKVSAARPGRVLWQVEPDDTTDGFLEIWFPADFSVIANEVRVRVTAPDGSISEPIAANETRVLRAGGAVGATLSAAAMFRSHAANGEGSAMFLLAVQSTAQRGSGPGAGQAGLWTLEIACGTTEEIDVHAWVERDDHVSGNLSGKQQSSLVDPRNGDPSVSLKFGLSSLAHGKHTVVAGGYCLSDCGVSDSTASGPGRGPRSRRGPDVSAPSDESRATPGLLVAGATTGVVNRLSGTSAAAPSVTRWVANWCVDRPGVLDIAMLRGALDLLPGQKVKRGPPPGPEVVTGTVDDVGRQGRIRIDARLEPTVPSGEAMSIPQARRAAAPTNASATAPETRSDGPRRADSARFPGPSSTG